MSQKVLTTEEWVRRLNKLGAKMDEIFFAVHPSAWATDPYLISLNEQYRELARRPTFDPLPVQQMSLWKEGEL